MREILFEDICHVNHDTDVFVGIKYEEGENDKKKITVTFPHGYRLENDEIGKREDVFLLIKTIYENCNHKKSEIPLEIRKDTDDVEFPIQAYLFLIFDFMERGYYKETEIEYKAAKRGKIDWPRTIKTQKPYIQDGNAIYLNFVTRKTHVDEDQLITLIHEYCVYESFDKMGWLFTDFMPEKPRFNCDAQIDLCISVVQSKINSTFNDRNKQLFQNMKAMLSYMGDNKTDTSFAYGTTDFEYVWERMVNHLYGEPDRNRYYPPTYWMINGKKKDATSELRPDTIMREGDKIFVLDSKYYKYCDEKDPNQLPKAESINKQITYGEYIAETEKFKINGKYPTVYNAFILPFDKHDKKFHAKEPLYYIGYATGDWKVSGKEYEIVIGILMDVKYLMQTSNGKDLNEIDKLAQFIEKEYLNCVKTTKDTNEDKEIMKEALQGIEV